MEDKSRPSEVFLELWQTVTTLDSELPAEDFARYAQGWRQIVSLEEIYFKAQALADGGKILRCVQDDREDVAPDRDDRENTTTIAMADNSAGGASPSPTSPLEARFELDTRKVTYDCSSAPMPDPEEVTHANRSAGAKAGFATRKRNLTERLEGLRRDGHKLHEIAEAVPGLTINDVMDALEAKAISPMKIQALERAVRKLEEAQAGE